MSQDTKILPKIISGGQTGADIAGLRAAKRCGLETGGTAAKGWMTEKGPNPELKSFGLLQSGVKGYLYRTKKNVIQSNVTLLLAKNPASSGSAYTQTCCIKLKRPFFIVHFDEKSGAKEGQLALVRDWLWNQDPKVINIAGNRESIAPGLEKGAEDFLFLLFTVCGWGEKIWG